MAMARRPRNAEGRPLDKGGPDTVSPARLDEGRLSPGAPSIRPELPERQRALLALLRERSDRDPAGRLVSTWTQPQLATTLGLSVRTLRRVLDDLRELDTDPRHSSTDRPPGRRLGLVKVEPILREPPGGGRLYAENLYVLAESWPVGAHGLSVAPEGGGR
jgi:hypothetical protein